MVIGLSQNKKKPSVGPNHKKNVGNAPKKPKKFFSRSNLSKVILPSLFLLTVILTPVLFEAFNLRHQRIRDVVEAPVPGNWYDDLFNGAPTQDIDPDDDQNFTDGFMDGFTNGVSDPERELFRYSNPSDTNLYFRYEVYDHYLMINWDKISTTSTYTPYSGVPGYCDGEFTIETDTVYNGGTIASYFPAPYHYIYNEEFSSTYAFSPSIDWISSSSEIQEDFYGAKLISSQFEPTAGNTTLSYDVAYTLQNNSLFGDNSAGHTELSTHISTDPTLTERYLQIPADYATNAPYTNTMASTLYNPSITIYDQINIDMAWLSTNCTYDIDMLLGQSDEEPAPGQDYVEWFLQRGMGTAAHFASSLAILGRLQGIPTRIIVGFSYGEPDVASDYVIRAKHVHSWVEVFIPFSDSEGYWVAFDPSPLLPGFRDEYGLNTIGFETVFYCSNEFYLPPHLYPNPTPPPYFLVNPLSSAWHPDPYNPSTYYGPYVNRSQEFTILAYLANGKDEEFLNYILTGDPGNLAFIAGETITFIDTTDDITLGTAVTDSDGYAAINYTYQASASVGIHYIRAQWLGLEVPTHNLLVFPMLEESGVILTGTINISSAMPEPIIGFLDLSLESYQYFTQDYTYFEDFEILQLFKCLSQVRKFI